MSRRRQARRARARLRQFFDRYDLLLSPTMPIPAAYADPRDDDLPNPNNSWSGRPIPTPFNLTKNPSASIPCGFADGLPIGLMVTGPLYDDLAVLQACRAYEEAAGEPWPSPALIAALAKVGRHRRRGRSKRTVRSPTRLNLLGRHLLASARADETCLPSA